MNCVGQNYNPDTQEIHHPSKPIAWILVGMVQRVKIRDNHLNNLRFTDDTVLFGESATELQQ